MWIADASNNGEPNRQDQRGKVGVKRPKSLINDRCPQCSAGSTPGPYV